MTPHLDRFKRFRRHKKEPPPDSVANQIDLATDPKRPATAPGLAIPLDPGTTPPVPAIPPLNQQSKTQQLQAQASRQRNPIPTVFRQLKARASAKRARSPAMTQVPVTAVVSHETAAQLNPPRRSGSMMDLTSHISLPSSATVLKRPSFLDASNNDMTTRYQDIVWRERARVQSSAQNPSPSHVWAKCSPPTYPEYLDRYTNISPWNNNRVRLRVPPGKVNYINASPIELQSPSTPSRTDKYIAMQGPTLQSWPHVWRMVTEQLDSPAVIVMLTETHEASGAEKCWPYFPRDPDSTPMVIEDEFGDGFKASVRCAELIPTTAGDAIELRKLVVKIEGPGNPGGQVGAPQSESDPGAGSPLDMEHDGGVPFNANRLSSSSTSTDFASDSAASARNSPSTCSLRPRPSPSPAPSVNISTNRQNDPPKAGDERVVYHFLYKKWPDFGVPQMSDLSSFFTLMRLSRQYNSGDDNPRVVHCSAGVGRSGTFIALEHLMKELEAGYLEHYDENWVGRLSAPVSSRSSFTDAQDTETGSFVSYPGGGGVPINVSGNLAPPPPPPNAASQPGAQMTSQLAAIEALGKRPPRYGSPPDLIFETVDSLRRQRKTMVQAESQYFFLYEVLKILWRDKYARTEGEPAAKRLEIDPLLAK